MKDDYAAYQKIACDSLSTLKAEKAQIETQILGILVDFREKYNIKIKGIDIHDAWTCEGKAYPIAVEIEVGI